MDEVTYPRKMIKASVWRKVRKYSDDYYEEDIAIAIELSSFSWTSRKSVFAHIRAWDVYRNGVIDFYNHFKDSGVTENEYDEVKKRVEVSGFNMLFEIDLTEGTGIGFNSTIEMLFEHLIDLAREYFFTVPWYDGGLCNYPSQNEDIYSMSC